MIPYYNEKQFYLVKINFNSSKIDTKHTANFAIGLNNTLFIFYRVSNEHFSFKFGGLKNTSVL